MSWLRVHDGFHDDPVIDRIGNEAAGAFIRCSAYCADKGTDGFISRKRALVIAKARVYVVLEKERLMLRVTAGQECVVTDRKDSGRRPLNDVSVLMPEDGWFIPKYLHYNFTSAEVKERSRRRAAGESTPVRTLAQSGERTLESTNSRPDPYTNLQVLKDMPA